MKDAKTAIGIPMKNEQWHTVSQAALTLFAALLLLFLCSTLVFYPMIRFFDAQAGPEQPWGPVGSWVYIGARGLRFVIALALCNLLRSRSVAALAQCEPQRKRVLTVLLAAGGVLLLLEAVWMLKKSYFIIADMVGVYDMPLFLGVLWEDLFYGDFGWMLLIGAVILFLPRMEKKKLALAQLAIVAAVGFVRFAL